MGDAATDAAPEPPGAFDRALAAHQAGDHATAEAAYGEALAQAPTWIAAYNLGILLSAQGRFTESLQLFEWSDALNPARAKTLSAWGNALLQLARLPEAEGRLRAALQLAPDHDQISERLAQCLLMQGAYPEGWDRNERRGPRVSEALLRLGYPEWSGGDLRGAKLLVLGEQGLGDEIQFARFLPALRAQGPRRLTLAVQPPNLEILSGLGADLVAPRPVMQLAPGEYDAWVLLGSLPHRLGVDLGNLPDRPYLAAPAARTSGIGVVWRGRPQHWNDARRSLPPELGRELLGLPGAVGLAPEETGARSMAETARIVAGLDLVITVDSSVAHLAGAMGKPTWVLLPAIGCDWRWMTGRTDTPWYPSVTLFRQETPGDWRPVIARLRERLG